MTCQQSEARFTPPHPECPHPEYWHSPDPDSTESEVSELVAALIRAVQPDLAVETGSAFGYTTYQIGWALQRNGHGVLVSLETDPTRASFARQSCKDLPVYVLTESSLDWHPTEDQSIDFAFFDSLYELRADEFRCYREWMSPGTICCFHDTTSGLRGHYMDVAAEVRKLEDEGLLKFVTIPSPRGLAIAEVR